MYVDCSIAKNLCFIEGIIKGAENSLDEQWEGLSNMAEDIGTNDSNGTGLY